MRRKRSLGVSTSIEEASSLSPRHAMSPRSPMSEGTLDSSMDVTSTYTGNASTVLAGNTSFVGSVIGHDDPTLIHANIQECLSGIIESATMSSFFTDNNSFGATSDEIRDSSHISRSGLSGSERQLESRIMSDNEFLERELSELDRAQEAWKARHHQQEVSSTAAGAEMDSTADFYLDEVGRIHRSPPRQTSLALHEQTIFEEDEFCEESSRDHSDGGISPEERYVEVLASSKDEIVMASGVGVGTSSVASSVVESVPSDLVFEYPSTEESNSNGTLAGNFDADNKTTVNTTDLETGGETDEVVRQVQRRLYDLSFNETNTGTELQYQEVGIPMEAERVEPPSDQRKKGFKSWIPIGDDSERPTSWFKPRSDLFATTRSSDVGEIVEDENYRKRRRKLCLLNMCLILLIIAAIVCSVLLALEFLSRDDRSDLATLVGSPTSAPSEGPPVKNPTFNLPSSTAGEPTGTSSSNSPSLPPIAEGTSGGEPPSDSPSTASAGDDFESSTSITMAPTSRTSPTDYPSEDADSSLTITSPPSSQSGSLSSPSSISRTGQAEGRLFDISGDAIFDPNTPQYAAYDWLLNSDPANLDLDSLSGEELSQRYVAALFYFSLNGDNWVEKYRFLEESNVCEWNNGSSTSKMGIICESNGTIDEFTVNQYGPIMGIVMNDNNLNGSLPTELEALKGLSTIQLRSNSVSGELPSGLGSLSALQEVDLRENDLQGTVPESIFNLPDIRKILLLRNPKLGGTIPSSISQASNLELLSFQKCQLTGTLPDALGSLSNLFFVTFLSNRLTGTLPPRLTQLPKLEVLELSENSLRGTIPGFGGQNGLYFVSLNDNELTGEIPVSLGSLPSLMFLDLQNNLLTGTVPRIMGRLPNLVTFFAENNQLEGNLPSFSGNDGLLQAIDLSNNSLSGNLNAFLGVDGPTSRLYSIDLGKNKFIGSIPSAIGGFNALKELLLEENSLTGSIPNEIGALTELDTLVLRKNVLSGTLPEEIGLIESLMYIDLGYNQIQGTIIDTLIMLAELEVLGLESNQLVGSVPSSFAQLSNLNELYLQDNELQGDLTNTFCTTSDSLGIFVSDCLGPNADVICSCCTICCNDSGCQENAT